MKKNVIAIKKDIIEIDGYRYFQEINSEGRKVCGTSARGLWNTYTDGKKKHIKIYKADLSKEAGKILFN